jgi:hypothetical protein
MLNDRIALHGFGRMFMHYFNEQLINVNSIREYITLRGGRV